MAFILLLSDAKGKQQVTNLQLNKDRYIHTQTVRNIITLVDSGISFTNSILYQVQADDDKLF